MNWTDIEEIAESLEELHHNMDILSLRFTLLRKLVIELPDFSDEENKSNEKILEAIQAAWFEIRQEKSSI